MSTEEEIVSMVSNGVMNAVEEHSDSDSTNGSPNKRQREENNAATSSFARFKGVVLQQNGHWGAQIYANHQRIWLGTFKSEKEAAMAYDSAAIKVRSGDPHRNYPESNVTMQERNFQALYSKDAILNMIKEGSYQSKLLEFISNRSLIDNDAEVLGSHNMLRGPVVNADHKGYSCQQLFEKELTPSDVGKLNRLVIPKKYAVKYFPPVTEANSTEEDNQNNGGEIDDIEVVFFDKDMKQWKFRYCYWKSSQSFVFTRGWNRFVKEKDLKATDVITFYRYEYRNWYKELQSFCVIDVSYNGDEESNVINGGLAVGGFDDGCTRKRLELELGYSWKTTSAIEQCGTSAPEKRKRCEEEEKGVMGVAPKQPVVDDKKVLRLFGVNLSIDD